jgi:hypothetical protein
MSKRPALKTLSSSAILLALVLAGVVPFAARAVYLDEHIYLHVAKCAIEKDWKFPQDMPWVSFGIHIDNLAVHTHPPAGEYFLALLLKIYGRFEEVRFRLAWAIFPFLAVLGFYRLARHFTSNPLPVASLFAVSPAFFVYSPTLMMDMPMLAFLLLGLAFYLDSFNGRQVLLFPASACFILSAGTGYTALVPLGCLFVWAVAKRRPLRELSAMTAAPLALFLWLVLMKSHFGIFPAAIVVRYMASHSSVFANILPTFSFIGGVSLLPWAFLALAEIPHKVLLTFCSVVAGLLMSFFHNWPTLPARLWFIVLASSGAGLLIAFVFKSRPRDTGDCPQPQGRGFLLVWLPAALLFFLFSAEIVNARYILLCLPPLFLITFASIRPRAAVPVIAATLVLSALIATGDYRFVNSYRDWVSQTVVPLQQSGFRVWSATESGLRFYLERRGVPTLSSSDLTPAGGDLIVKQASFAYSLNDELGSLLIPLRKTDLLDSFPVRTFSASAGAGFHDSNFGFVPFSFSRAPLDRLEVAEVSPFVTALPEKVPADFSSVPVWFPGGVLLKQIQPEMRFRIRIPEGARVEYELEGEGSLEVSGQWVTLRRTGKGPAVWKNFRIVPQSWNNSGRAGQPK